MRGSNSGMSSILQPNGRERCGSPSSPAARRLQRAEDGGSTRKRMFACHFTSALAQWKLWIAGITFAALAACAGSSTTPVSSQSAALMPASPCPGCPEVVPSKIVFPSPKSGARTIRVHDWGGKAPPKYGCKTKRIVTISPLHVHFYGWSTLRVKPIGAVGECLYQFYGHYEGRTFFHAIVGK